MTKIVCFHLLNDYSGSPKVLKMIVEGLLTRGCSVDLVTTKGGVLDQISLRSHLRVFHFHYHFSTNHLLTMMRYLFSQIYIFCFSFRYLFQRDRLFYINTILPVGAALGGKISGHHVVYHYHENAFVKSRTYRVLARIMQCIADEIICVSQYQASFLNCKEKITIVPNALPHEFGALSEEDATHAFTHKTILMVTSLKRYKGVDEFITLAQMLPQYSFTMVINEEQNTIDGYMRDNGCKPSSNLKIYPRQDNVIPFYQASSLVLNLSNKELAIETFGLTALEAMSLGLPVIVPTVGGIAEMVEDDYNGFKIDVCNLEMIKDKICEILTNKELYIRLTQGALSTSLKYDEPQIMDILTKKLMKN